MSLKEDVKTEWCRRLRSGEFEQGSHCLRSGGKWCCLGVLADVIRPDLWKESNDAPGTYLHAGFVSFPDSDYLDEIGLNYIDAVNLYKMNDGRGQLKKSFSEIAGHIEANL